MNITVIESGDVKTVERIAALLTALKHEFITKPAREGYRQTIFVVFCSRTNHELYTLWYKLKLNKDNLFEIRGVANHSCRDSKGVPLTNVKSCYAGVLLNAHGTVDIGSIID